MATYSECPHCGKGLSVHLRNVWDYQTYFDTTCPHCGKEFGVMVDSEPIFVCEKLTNAEQDQVAARRFQDHLKGGA